MFSRRTLLRGLGTGTVLLSGLSRTLHAQARTPRAVFFFYANGSHPAWTPTGAGADFVLTPHLAPLEPIRKDIVICKNMTLAEDHEKNGQNQHFTTARTALGCGAPTSFDQLLARHVKGTTPVASLEISIGHTSGGGGVIPGLSQVDGNFIPGVRNPVTAYQRIAERVTAGAPAPSGMPSMATPSGAEQALLARRSLLDFLREDVGLFRNRLGAEEKPKLDFYLESLRTLERNVGTSVAVEIKPSAGCARIAPPDALLSKDVRVNDMPQVNRLFLDTIAMGLACGVTRVASAMWGGGQSEERIDIPALNIKLGDWHWDSHGDLGGPQGQNIIRMQAFLAGEVTYFVQKLKSYADGAGSLLDSTVVVFGTQNGSCLVHGQRNTPLVLAGSGGGAWQTGKIIDCENRNHNDVYLRIAQAFGMNVTTVGDPAWCKGPMPALV